MEKLKHAQFYTGFFLNPETGRLETIERISTTYCFAGKGTVSYKCMLAGMETVVYDNEMTVYNSVEDYNAGHPIELMEISLAEVFKRIYHYEPVKREGSFYTCEWKDGKFQAVCIDNYRFCWSVDSNADKHEFYRSFEECCLYRDGVRMVNKPPTVSDSDKVIHSEITSKLVEFLEVGESFAIETAQLNDFPVGIFSKEELTELANAESIVLHG